MAFKNYGNWNQAQYNGANDKEQTMQLQALLKNGGQNVSVDGVWKDSDNAALKNAGADTFQATNRQKTNYGWVNSGNTVPWYSSEADRVKRNAAHLAKDGVAFNTVTDDMGRSYQTWQSNANNGAFGKSDSTGGVFNKAGMSSNPYYLNAVIGASRDQVEATPEIAGISDLMLQRAYEAGQGDDWGGGLNFDDYYVTPSGKVGTLAGTEGAVRIGDIREALAKLTGQQTKMGGGFNGGISAAFVKPDFYNPYAGNASPANYGERQKTEVIDPFLQRLQQMAAQGGSSIPAANPVVDAILSNQYRNRELEENERRYKED